MCRTNFKKQDSRALRQTLGQYPTGVAVVTTVDENGQLVGMTINSFCSLSMNPPLVAWSVDRSANSYRAFDQCGGYTISVLASDQVEIARRFATPGADKFQGMHRQTDKGIAIAGACAWLECTVYRRLIVGDHLMLIGEVKAFSAGEAQPLVFAQGSFTETATPEPTKQDLTKAA